MELNHESNGKQYGFETKEVGTGWNGDTGFRHRVVCEDGRHSGWAEYTRVSFLDDVACISPYYHDTSDMRLVTVAQAMAFIAVGEEKPEAEEADDETVALRELSEIPTHIWFPGKSVAKRARSPFETCWKVAPHSDDDAGTMTFCDYEGNEYCTVSGYGIPNEHGSIVLPLSEYILVLDTVNQVWGTGPTLEKAIGAMPNNMEDLPFTCAVYVSDKPMRVTENGCIRGTGDSVPVQVLAKEGRKVKPVMPK